MHLNVSINWLLSFLVMCIFYTFLLKYCMVYIEYQRFCVDLMIVKCTPFTIAAMHLPLFYDEVVLLIAQSLI